MEKLALDLNSIKVPTTGTSLIDVNSGNTKIGTIISAILPYIFGAAGIALLVYLVIGGLQYMTSRGDPKAMQAAQAKITSALIGFLIVVLAFTITQLIAQVFGIRNTIFGQIFNTSTI